VPASSTGTLSATASAELPPPPVPPPCDSSPFLRPLHASPPREPLASSALACQMSLPSCAVDSPRDHPTTVLLAGDTAPIPQVTPASQHAVFQPHGALSSADLLPTPTPPRSPPAAPSLSRDGVAHNSGDGSTAVEATGDLTSLRTSSPPARTRGAGTSAPAMAADIPPALRASPPLSPPAHRRGSGGGDDVAAAAGERLWVGSLRQHSPGASQPSPAQRRRRHPTPQGPEAATAHGSWLGSPLQCLDCVAIEDRARAFDEATRAALHESPCPA